MRQVLGYKGAVAAGTLAAALFGFLTPSQAQDAAQNAGFSLPGVTMPSGTDEVRAADGTSCRSAVGGNGAYLDVGVIGKQSTSNDNAYYGRVVVPLGRAPKRLNCTALYELEIERLKLELELAKAGMGRTQDPEVDSTETSSLEDPIPADAPVADTVVPEKPSKKKKNAAEVVEASVEEPVAPVAVEPAKKKKPAAKKKVGKAGWDQEGWSTDGLDGGAG
jgi:hypothetical protein